MVLLPKARALPPMPRKLRPEDGARGWYSWPRLQVALHPQGSAAGLVAPCVQHGQQVSLRGNILRHHIV